MWPEMISQYSEEATAKVRYDRAIKRNLHNTSVLNVGTPVINCIFILIQSITIKSSYLSVL